MVYIGNTQQKLKCRMDQHLGDVVKLVNKDEKSDSFASHFASHYEGDNDKETKLKRKDVQSKVKVEIIWQGDAISCMKSFGQLNCCLCMQEQLEILKMSKQDPENLINSKLEIYGTVERMRIQEETRPRRKKAHASVRRKGEVQSREAHF